MSERPYTGSFANEGANINNILQSAAEAVSMAPKAMASKHPSGNFPHPTRGKARSLKATKRANSKSKRPRAPYVRHCLPPQK